MNGAAIHAAAAQQQAISSPAPLFMRACPGAGKTHVIVARHLGGPAMTLRGGRAVLSYTRAAAQQIRDRCHRAGRPDATAHPHYIGTLDGFLWHHLVVPYRRPDRPLQLLDTWDRLNATVTLGRHTLPLSAFTFGCLPDNHADTIHRDLMPAAYQRLIQASDRSWDAWTRQAYAVRRYHCARGYVTGHEVRQLALQHLDRHPDLAGTLRSRFAEIVIDEAQDCSTTDLDILGRLHRHGLPLIVVADPDQMIYGWRGADPTRLAALENDLGTTIALAGNWRSTSTVCRLAATLRTGARPPDIAVRVSAEESPVLLLPAVFTHSGQSRHLPSGRPVTDVFLDHAHRHGISQHQCLTATHRREYPPAAGRPATGNPATRLAHAWHTLRSATADPDPIDNACRTSAHVLLRYWYPHLDPATSLEDQCITAALDPNTLARYALAFLHALPEPGPAWPQAVNEHLKNTCRPPGAAPQRTTGYLRGKPTKPFAVISGCRTTTSIHQIKGTEYPAVLLLLPDQDTANRWASADAADDEILRAWYVAVTRAQRLLAISLGPEQLPAVAELLRNRGVPALIG